MTKTVYVHFGHYKTGSTAIQEYCARHRDFLASRGINYLVAGRADSAAVNHSALALALARDFGFTPPQWFKGDLNTDKMFSEVISEIDKSEDSTFLISSEEFVQLAIAEDYTAALQSLNHRLDPYTIKIVFFIRDPFDLLKSWYNELNKGPRGTRPFPVFFKNVQHAFLSQAEICQRLAACFGAENVIIKRYQYLGIDHIADFLGALSISGDLPPVDVRVAQKAQPLESLEQRRIAKRQERSLGDMTLTKVGSIKSLAQKIRAINAEFDTISPPLQSQLSLKNIFAHHEALISPLIEQGEINDNEAIKLRDLAIEASENNVELAIQIMEIAQRIRPNGQLITKKLHDLKCLL